MNSTSTAVRLHPAYDDPSDVRMIIDAAGPFWPIGNYAGTPEELAAIGGSKRSTFLPPWFRQDFALEGKPLVVGAERILQNPRFVEAAHRVYGAAAIVRPTTVYVNVMGPTSFPFAPHLDVPAFRGLTRADYPIWLLKKMMTSGLFEQWRTRLATAVSWFYDGPGGGFHYWPEGPDGPECAEEPPFDNVAVVADNEATFHGVAPLGRRDDRMPMGLTRDSSLVRGDGGWDVLTDGATVAHYPDEIVRVTVSWKADVFHDTGEARLVDEHLDDLPIERVVEAFLDDLGSRGVEVETPTDALHDPVWIEALTSGYPEPAPRIG